MADYMPFGIPQPVPPQDTAPLSPDVMEMLLAHARQQLANQQQPVPLQSAADQAAMSPETYINPMAKGLLSSIGSLASIPQRAIDASAQDVQHLGETGYQKQSVGPATDATLAMLGGSMPFAEKGAVGALGGKLGTPGFQLSKEYYDKIPMEMRMSSKGVSHPGVRWEVYDPTTDKVMRSDLTTRTGASRSKDRLDNQYGAYRYQVRPTPAKEMTEAETQFLKDNNIDFRIP